jgi:hypothetical protein
MRTIDEQGLEAHRAAAAARHTDRLSRMLTAIRAGYRTTGQIARATGYATLTGRRALASDNARAAGVRRCGKSHRGSVAWRIAPTGGR